MKTLTEELLQKAICKTPGVSGGAACIRSTRIPVWTLVQLKKPGRTDDQLLPDFPSLTPADLNAAWSYYAAKPAEIDHDIAAQQTDIDDDEQG